VNLKGIVFVVAIAAGLQFLAAPPVAALCSLQCTCETSCDTVCRSGPFEPDCPECGLSTCGDWGVCVGTCGSSDPCDNNAYTTTINGTSGGDTLTGTAANELINGLGGNDTIYGNAGDDTIYGGSGADTVYGGSGDDCMYGEGGNDHLTGDTGSSDFADGGAGTDTCNAETEVSCEI
jgi:Ca2+-binding RTX toxin-like protein